MSGTHICKASLDIVGPTVILVEPQLGENIGMAARAMVNCGLSQLRLVAPRDGWPNRRRSARLRAPITCSARRLFAT